MPTLARPELVLHLDLVPIQRPLPGLLYSDSRAAVSALAQSEMVVGLCIRRERESSNTASLFFCSSLTTRPSHAQIPTLCVFKPNHSFLSLFSSLSPHNLTSSSRRTPTCSFAPKAAETESPLVEAEIQTEAEPLKLVDSALEGAKLEEVFAVVMIGSRQYIVIPGRFIYSQKFKGAKVNDKVILNKVLLVGTKTSTYIGYPIVQNAVIHAVVEEQPNTRLRIIGITGYENSPAVTLP
ncbi:50S ribosomal protein L21, chloroplastic-like [Actinidia eriantha]|uniref:50S ribosomal protein L21, chloroplastic-like n=1 Tax=Actinidia eriantha TaxID=165200 RepID=UPI0025850A8B|nr:50S ribosomal protein L21, chloroplastic-like [Actinidia eriantha]